MDLNRLPNDKKLQLCRWYFKGKKDGSEFFEVYAGDIKINGCFLLSLFIIVGCILLPFVWAVNAVWFFKEAFLKPPFEEQKQIKRYVLMSAGGATVWACSLAAWVSVFQTRRVSWGAIGDSLSFIVPLGQA